MDHQQFHNIAQSPDMIPPVTLTPAPVISLASTSSESENSISLSQPADFTNMQQFTQQNSFSDPFKSFLSQVQTRYLLTRHLPLFLPNFQCQCLYKIWIDHLYYQNRDLNGIQGNPLILTKLCRKCYGCGEDFAAKYNTPTNNLIIKHIDRRIRGENDLGHILYNADFTTYYNFNKAHIMQKNPYGECIVKYL